MSASDAAVEFVIRAAGAADAPCISVLGSQVFLDTYAPDGIGPSIAREVRHHLSLEAVDALLAMPATRVLVAEHAERTGARAGVMVGFAQLTLDAPHPLVGDERAVELQRLYVLERFTGRGIGAALLRGAEELAASSGAVTLWLTAWEGNRRARAFYARHGYEDVGATLYTFEGEEFENRLFAKRLA